MTTIISAKAAHDFLALVPELAGFRPVQSIVLVAFRANRSCGALRIDLPKSIAADALSAMASSLIGMVCRIPGVDALVPVVYTTKGFGAGSVPPHGELIDAFVFHAELSGFLVRDALCVASDGWGSYLDASTPIGGHALSMITSSAVVEGRDAGSAGHGGHGDHSDQNGPAIRQVKAELVVRQRVGKLIKRLRSLAADPSSLLASGSPTGGADEIDALLNVPEIAENALSIDAEQLPDLDAAAILCAMQSPPTRDSLLVQWAFGAQAGQQTEQENCRYAAGEPGAGAASARLLWGEGPRPDPHRIEDAIALLDELLARAPRATKPAALSMLAWLNWALGRSSRAGVYLRMAFEIDARYGFADILERMLSAGHLPEWAFAVPFDGEGNGTVHTQSL